jgi:hypothetical protein
MWTSPCPNRSCRPFASTLANGALKVEATVPGRETNASVGELRLD